MDHPKRWAYFATGLFAFIVCCCITIGATDAWLRFDIAARRAAIDIRLARAQAAALRAQELATHDRSVIYAVCLAFKRRDVEDSRHTSVIAGDLSANGPTLNRYQRTIDPEVIRHGKALNEIAALNCNSLMEQELRDAPLFKPTPEPRRK